MASIEVVMKKRTSGDGEVDCVLKLKLWNKNDAIKVDYESYRMTDGGQVEAGPDVPAFTVAVRPAIT